LDRDVGRLEAEVDEIIRRVRTGDFGSQGELKHPVGLPVNLDEYKELMENKVAVRVFGKIATLIGLIAVGFAWYATELKEDLDEKLDKSSFQAFERQLPEVIKTQTKAWLFDNLTLKKDLVNAETQRIAEDEKAVKRNKVDVFENPDKRKVVEEILPQGMVGAGSDSSGKNVQGEVDSTSGIVKLFGAELPVSLRKLTEAREALKAEAFDKAIQLASENGHYKVVKLLKKDKRVKKIIKKLLKE